MPTSLRHFSIEKRTQIANYYRDGLKVKEIATLYGTDEKTINNVLAYMRKHGVEVPFRRVHSKKRLASTTVGTPKRHRYSHTQKREAYRIFRTTGEIRNVQTTFEVNKKVAYYLVGQGKQLNGVKGRTRIVETVTPTKKKVTSDNVGFFVLGVVVTVLVVASL